MPTSAPAKTPVSLGEIMRRIPFRGRIDPQGIDIAAITSDSRQVEPGTLFVALPGQRVDGHQFVAEAGARGAAAVLVQRRARISRPGPVALFEVADTRQALGQAAAAFYRRPADDLTMVGITGTNGKTTTTFLLERLIEAAGGRPGVIGTVNYRYAGLELPAPFTTPEPVALHGLLRQMADSGVTHVIMEVSSHGLVQKRLEEIFFDVALFTNLSRDHLDFHRSMTTYFRAKRQLFLDHLKREGKAVIVRGDEPEDWGGRLARELPRSRAWQAGGRTRHDLVTCGLGPEEMVQSARHRFDLTGMQARLRLPGKEMELSLELVGEFNLENVLGAAGVGVALGLPSAAIKRGLESVPGVPGRLEKVSTGPAWPTVLVDYAHTPAALEKVLTTLRRLGPSRLIVVFGCGGDRDRGKRPLMGEVAGRLADVVLVTSDNPRSEEPGRILTEIEAGLLALARGRTKGSESGPLSRCRAEVLLRSRKRRGYDLIESRREAIGLAVRYGRLGEVVLISGKGHENYQLGPWGRIFFDDRFEARQESARLPC